MSHLTSKFIKGFFAILPILLSIVILVWIFNAAESVAREVLLLILPEWAYIPGLGILVSMILITFVGHLIDQKLTRRIFELLEGPFQILPVVRSIYTALKDFTQYLSPQAGQKQLSRVVLVNLSGVQVVGLVTRSTLEGLPQGLNKPEHVAVYIPMSYQFGGYTVFIHRDQVQELNLSTEQAMRSVLTAWVSGGGKSI